MNIFEYNIVILNILVISSNEKKKKIKTQRNSFEIMFILFISKYKI